MKQFLFTLKLSLLNFIQPFYSLFIKLNNSIIFYSVYWYLLLSKGISYYAELVVVKNKTIKPRTIIGYILHPFEIDTNNWINNNCIILSNRLGAEVAHNKAVLLTASFTVMANISWRPCTTFVSYYYRRTKVQISIPFERWNSRWKQRTPREFTKRKELCK